MTEDDIPPTLDTSKLPTPKPLSSEERIRLTQEALKTAKDEQLKQAVEKEILKLKQEQQSND